MPPKTKGKPEAAAALGPEMPPPPDPNVLLYLQASGRAFPRVSQYLQHQQDELEELAHRAEEATVKAQQHAKQEVTAFAIKRVALEAEVVELEIKKRELQAAIDAGRAAFEEEFQARKLRNMSVLASMQEETDSLQKDAAQAENWSYRAQGQTKELEALDAKIADRRAAYAAEIEKMHADHEADKRRMRDALVRRLRRARDFMTSSWGNTTEDATSGDMLDAVGGGGAGVKSGAATARINEELSRELSIREREAASQVASIKELEELQAKLTAELEQEQSANTQLLLRNASYTKTRRVLEAKLSELKTQLSTVLDRRSAHEKDRLGALRGTVAMQATVINELNSEIDLHIADLKSVNRRLRATRTVLSNVDSRVSSAMRFLWALAGPASAAASSSNGRPPAVEAFHAAPLTPHPPHAAASLSSTALVTAPRLQDALVVPTAMLSDTQDCSESRDLSVPQWTRIHDRHQTVSFLMNLVVGGSG